MSKDKIYFNLNTREPQILSAKYKGRIESIGLAIVPAVMDAEIKGIPLSYQDMIKLAEKYLRAVLL